MSENGNGKVSWEWFFKLVQVLLIPALGVIFLQQQYASRKQSDIENRLTAIEVTIRQPDAAQAAKLAVIEVRQAEVIVRLKELEAEMQHHREKSTYDPAWKR